MIVAAFIQIPPDRLFMPGWVLANVELNMHLHMLHDPLDIFQPIFTNVQWILPQ